MGGRVPDASIGNHDRAGLHREIRVPGTILLARGHGRVEVQEVRGWTKTRAA